MLKAIEVCDASEAKIVKWQPVNLEIRVSKRE